MREVTISPSLICTDLCNIERDVHNLEAAIIERKNLNVRSL